MQHSASFSLVVPSSTRSYGDDNWRESDGAYVEAWKSAVALLSVRKVSFGGIHYEVAFDWTPMLRRHERHYSAMSYVERGKGSEDLSRRLMRASFPRRPTRIPITAKATNARRIEAVVQSLLHDVFLIMNIAAPGCCNFYRATLLGEKSARDLSLSSSEFELCILPTGKRPEAATFVPVPQVASWYQSIRSDPAQIPASPTERALFALLHLAKFDSEMLSAIWLFYAFESLLQTKVGENLSSIVRRLSLLLGLSGTQVAKLKKEMRTLYDLRSAIVHGGFETIHPMKDEALDKRVNDVYARLLAASEYGHVVLVMALQRMAELNRRQLDFEEVLLS